MTGIEIPSEFRDSKYRIRRAQNWLLVGLMYSFFYMTRYNFSAIAPTLQDFFGWTKSDLGLFETLMPLAYGLAVFFNAPLADRFGGRKSFLFGSVGVIIMNAAFGAFYLMVDTPAQWAGEGSARHMVEAAQIAGGLSARGLAWIMAVLWAVNGYFQSFGALSIVKINAQWFHLKERGTFGAIFGVLIRFGLILAFSGAPWIVSILPWQWAFWIPAGFVVILFLCNLFFVVETPEEAGFEKRDTGDTASEEEEGGEKFNLMMVLKKVFTSSTMWMIAIASMMIGFVRRSVVDAWYPVYFHEVHGVAKTDLAYQLAAWGIALLGIAGGFAFGIMSDRIYKGRRAPVVVYGFIGMAISLGLFYLSDHLALGAWGGVACIVLLSFFVNGAHGIVGGAASMDFGGRKAAATAAGLFDGMQYLAGAFTGMAVGWITTEYDWQVWKLWPIPFAVVGALVMAKIWNAMPRGSKGH
ncbi:MAG: MFS transporter [Deltaproteobacteria bacterium]|nr:MFS transporter [Deltaproteobacteria bacterium]